MGNCVAKLCQARPVRIQPPAPAAFELVSVARPRAAPAAPARPASPTAPHLSASAQARWRQVCNRPLERELDARGLLQPGARLDLSFDERVAIHDALAHLPAGAHFLPHVATACILGNPATFEAVETLIRRGVLPANLVIDGSTMLQATCLHGQNAWSWIAHPLTLEHRIAALVALGANIGQPALPAIDLLQQTWERKDVEGRLAAAALIAHGCDPLQRDEQERTLLHRAAEAGNMPVLRGWQRAGLAMDLTAGEQGNTALHLAASNGHREAVRFLVTEGRVDVNALNLREESALHHAVLHSHVDVATTLLYLNASVDTVDERGYTPLMMAVLLRSDSMRELLVQRGADPRTPSPILERSADTIYEHSPVRTSPEDD